jgi:hypothetical protein
LRAGIGFIWAAEDEGMRDRSEREEGGGQKREEGAARQRAAHDASRSASAPLDKVDDASDDSFPASDAPAWTGIHVGSPRSDR